MGDVVQMLQPALASLTVASWLTSPNRALDGRTPIDVLTAGDRARVLRLARQLAGSAAN